MAFVGAYSCANNFPTTDQYGRLFMLPIGYQPHQASTASSNYSYHTIWTSIHPNLPPVPLGLPPPPSTPPSIASPQTITPALVAPPLPAMPPRAWGSVPQLGIRSSAVPLPNGSHTTAFPGAPATNDCRVPEMPDAGSAPPDCIPQDFALPAYTRTKRSSSVECVPEQKYWPSRFRFKEKKKAARRRSSRDEDQRSDVGTSGSSKPRSSPTDRSSPKKRSAPSSHPRRHRHRSGEVDGDEDRKRHRRSHRHHKTESSGFHTSEQNGIKPDGPVANDPFARPLDPEAAFRESLFDAMADDEGAAYWQGVYGHPVHEFIREAEAARNGESRTGSDKHPLELMTDDEYADYVRQRMWERTHPGQAEAREARARREREREEEQRRAEEVLRVAAEVERSLQRGRERRRVRARRAQWDAYKRSWAEWDGSTAGIPWPAKVGEGDEEIEYGGRGGAGTPPEKKEKKERLPITEESIRSFYVNSVADEEPGGADLAARLKEERVRWHPDKMQQRLGGTVDGSTMRDITAVFQIVDKLWNQARSARVKQTVF